MFELIDDEHVLLNMGSNKIKIVNLNTMTVVHTFQGKIPRSSDPRFTSSQITTVSKAISFIGQLFCILIAYSAISDFCNSLIQRSFNMNYHLF